MLQHRDSPPHRGSHHNRCQPGHPCPFPASPLHPACCREETGTSTPSHRHSRPYKAKSTLHLTHCVCTVTPKAGKRRRGLARAPITCAHLAPSVPRHRAAAPPALGLHGGSQLLATERPQPPQKWGSASRCLPAPRGPGDVPACRAGSGFSRLRRQGTATAAGPGAARGSPRGHVALQEIEGGDAAAALHAVPPQPLQHRHQRGGRRLDKVPQLLQGQEPACGHTAGSGHPARGPGGRRASGAGPVPYRGERGSDTARTRRARRAVPCCRSASVSCTSCSGLTRPAGTQPGGGLRAGRERRAPGPGPRAPRPGRPPPTGTAGPAPGPPPRRSSSRRPRTGTARRGAPRTCGGAVSAGRPRSPAETGSPGAAPPPPAPRPRYRRAIPPLRPVTCAARGA